MSPGLAIVWALGGFILGAAFALELGRRHCRTHLDRSKTPTPPQIPLAAFHTLLADVADVPGNQAAKLWTAARTFPNMAQGALLPYPAEPGDCQDEMAANIYLELGLNRGRAKLKELKK